MTTWSSTITRPQHECNGSLLSVLIGARYKWNSKFSISANDTTCKVKITVRLCMEYDEEIGNYGELQQRWKSGIEGKWSGKYVLKKVGGTAPCANFTVEVDVQFVSSDCDHTITVEKGSGREDMESWFDSTTGDTAAHEFGHMLGLKDEYPDEKCPKRSIPNETPPSIMKKSSGEVKKRHYKIFADWVSRVTGSTYRPD